MTPATGERTLRAQAEHRATEADHRAAVAERRALDAEHRALAAEARALDAERRAQAAEARAVAAEAALAARITEPEPAADVAKARLLAAVSHQVFTPVHQAQGSLELAVTATSDPWVRDQLARASAAIAGIERMFRNLVVVAEADAGGLAVAPADVALAEVVTAIADRWRRRATDQASLLVADVRLAGDLRLRTDELRLAHALDELLHNAVRFTRGGIVRVEAEAGADGVAIGVADEGPGLPPELLEHLFEPFTGEASHAGGGLGLGLAAAARIARSLGGHLERTEAPRGERFVLSLPR